MTERKTPVRTRPRSIPLTRPPDMNVDALNRERYDGLDKHDVFSKIDAFTVVERARDLQIYPFFQALDNNDGPIAQIYGKRVLMFGSNNYLGLTRHSDVVKAARDAVLKRVSKAALVVIDGVYSMGGDIADLPAIVEVCKRHRARLLVDDAHGIGVIGRGGRGTASHFGMESEVDLVMGTFSKSLASIGGFLAGPANVLEWVRH